MAFLYPSFNGVRASWAEVETRIRGFIALGIKALNYKPSLEPTDVYGAGSLPIGRTRGIAKFEGSMELLKEEMDSLIISLGPGFGEVSFDILASYRIDVGQPAIAPGPVHFDKLLGCRIKDLDNSNQQGADGLIVKANLSIMLIVNNGFVITSKLPPLGAVF
jgi:hypothetical protein